ncbi:MAG: hypothetical protein CR984_04155 [Proteobacteria bacterium]|nr:MAG: hypothetical protein CR984_04155 [Pseudomonadota bacterium]PIE66722.1 MAG: hypothetical protein CSA23_07740 [Deltaproteobacteria bacterium]
MKQKYVILVDHEAGKLAIQEYAELDKEMLSLLCEEAYDVQTIKRAIDTDRNALIQAIRTFNMYPPGVYMERIASAIIELFQPGANTSAELFFEEREMFESEDEASVDEPEAEDKDAGMNVDDLLEDDIEEDDFEEKGIIKSLKKNMKPSDDDSGEDDA